jgi:hypothetical protein
MHIDYLGGVKNLNARVLASDALQFRFDSGSIADQNQLLDPWQGLKRQGGTFNSIFRGLIAAHRV